jgi:hypothetical protein
VRTLSLTVNGNVELDGSGNGTIQLGPSHPGESWAPVSTSINCTGPQPAGVATCFIYAGAQVAPGTFVDSTYNVLGAASSLISGQTLYPGQYIWAVFTGGNPGQTASLVIAGTRNVP